VWSIVQAVLNEPRPRRCWSWSALMPGLWLVIRNAAANQSVSGRWLRWRTVPAVALVCRRQSRHCQNRRASMKVARSLPQAGQRNPSGQRVSTR
jgi:hypothetical protein